MKRTVTTLLALSLLLVSPLAAQKLSQLWKVTAGSKPQFLGTGDTYRGAAYNPATDHYLVVSRQIGLKVYVLNASTGDLLDSLNVAGITGGTFALNDVEVTKDGVIYAANLITQAGSDTTYRIYRWASETQAPAVAFSGRPGTARLGDSFDVAGTGTNTVIYASGNNAASVIQVFNTADGTNFTRSAPISITGQEAGAGIAQVTPGGNAYISRFAAGNKVDLVNTSGAVIGSVPDSVFGASVADLQYFEVGPRKFLAGAPAGLTNHDPARLLDVTAGPANPVVVDSTADLGNNANGNATGDVDVKINSNGSIVLFVLIGNNGLAAFQTSTPVSVEEEPLSPTTFSLNQNYPNPFNPTTSFEFQVPGSEFVSIKVFDVLGREVAVLANEERSAGVHKLMWDASALPSGVYLYRMQVGNFVATRKMVLAK